MTYYRYLCKWHFRNGDWCDEELTITPLSEADTLVYEVMNR